MKGDFEFLLGLVEEFFGQDEIQNKLNLLNQYEFTGWEIWFQVEFASFLLQHDAVAEMIREYPYSADRRMRGSQTRMHIDFLIRKKRSLRGSYIALEVKQNQSASSCVKGMMNDIHKVWKVKRSEDDLRSMWCLGIYPTVDDEKISQVIDKQSEAAGIELPEHLIQTKQVPNTCFSFTLL
ncbi:hypothetical protein [Pseudoalteromonas ardens]|uniref:Uncharacterized protein n=1 Tax=Pseudoalteromonas rubra TaxID=43658 RepID=A0A0L0EUK3_9GAMM|nr:hypothetical protein [Pseudoalteromonas sp. R96]KNC68089.1 hypothetical protein AC626_06840 [Pseudoalteromonas rubra]MDK1311354.1 hypothetical protein [Pseudoalteromonas sp. R96]